MKRLCIILALLGSSCSDDKDTAPAPSATTSPPLASAPPPTPSSSAPYRDDDLPVAPDYEAEAEKSITAKNYKDKLAEIEGDLGVPAASASASAAASAEAPPPPAPEPEEAD